MQLNLKNLKLVQQLMHIFSYFYHIENFLNSAHAHTLTVALKSILRKIKIGLIKNATEIQKLINFFIKLSLDELSNAQWGLNPDFDLATPEHFLTFRIQ